MQPELCLGTASQGAPRETQSRHCKSFPKRLHERLRGCPIPSQGYRPPLHLICGSRLPHLQTRCRESRPLQVYSCLSRLHGFRAAIVMKSHKSVREEVEDDNVAEHTSKCTCKCKYFSIQVPHVPCGWPPVDLRSRCSLLASLHASYVEPHFKGRRTCTRSPRRGMCSWFKS